MPKVIIYKQDNGVLAIVTPTPEILTMYSIEEVARKDVPFGKPYKIIDSSELPSDLSLRNAWTVDEADLTDGVGAESNEFPPLPEPEPEPQIELDFTEGDENAAD